MSRKIYLKNNEFKSNSISMSDLTHFKITTNESFQKPSIMSAKRETNSKRKQNIMFEDLN
jgi:hypothetical protein